MGQCRVRPLPNVSFETQFEFGEFFALFSPVRFEIIDDIGLRLMEQSFQRFQFVIVVGRICDFLHPKNVVYASHL